MKIWDWFRRKARPPAARSSELRPLRTMRGRVSAHEAGHAIVAWGATHVGTVTVLCEDDSGKTLCAGRPVPDISAAQWAELVVLLAGIAGELQVFGRFRSGPAASDLDKARALSAALIAAGYEPKVSAPAVTVPFSKMFVEPLTDEESRLFESAYGYARAIIRAHRIRFWRLVALLHSRGEVRDADLERVLGSRAPMKILAAIGVVTLVTPTGVSTEGEIAHVRN